MGKIKRIINKQKEKDGQATHSFLFCLSNDSPDFQTIPAIPAQKPTQFSHSAGR
ncbi:hypothetical protein ACTNDZ_12060 [Selenomonas montiformis]|uniref:hypothetical protein n=1 Tax=Selenomonas montiformis TaxID=2652285 RepID=UPI003F892BEE